MLEIVVGFFSTKFLEQIFLRWKFLRLKILAMGILTVENSNDGNSRDGNSRSQNFSAGSAIPGFGAPPEIFVQLEHHRYTSSEGVATFVKGYNLC